VGQVFFPSREYENFKNRCTDPSRSCATVREAGGMGHPAAAAVVAQVADPHEVTAAICARYQGGRRKEYQCAGKHRRTIENLADSLPGGLHNNAESRSLWRAAANIAGLARPRRGQHMFYTTYELRQAAIAHCAGEEKERLSYSKCEKLYGVTKTTLERITKKLANVLPRPEWKDKAKVAAAVESIDLPPCGSLPYFSKDEVCTPRVRNACPYSCLAL